MEETASLAAVAGLDQRSTHSGDRIAAVRYPLMAMKSALSALVALCLAGCGPAAIDGGFDSANPAARMYAIERAARDGDEQAIGRIVEQLDSDDPAVRLLAIGALERLTGETYGYRHYDDAQSREAAVSRWVHAIEEGSLMRESRQADQASTVQH